MSIITHATQHLHLQLDDEGYEAICRAGEIHRTTPSEWARQRVRGVLKGIGCERSFEERLAAIKEAGKYSFPTGDI